MFGWIFCATFVKYLKHFFLYFLTVITFFDYIILMEYMAHKVSIIEFMQNFVIQFGRKLLKPVFFITLKDYI